MGTVAIFGGSFDPPHVGHVLAVQYLLSVGLADQVIVVPVYQHAFNKRLTPFETRFRLVQLAYAEESRVMVSPIERQLPVPNYTLNTVQALAEQFPEAQFRLVVGADVLSDVDHWHSFDELIGLAPLIVLGRAGISQKDAPRAFLPEVSSSEIRALLSKLPGSNSPISGSSITAQAERTDPLSRLRMLLPKAVLSEILNQGLYQ